MKLINNTHDLTLSDWGPYSKKYSGISHVSNNDLGMRFDLSVAPGLYRRKIDLPTAMSESNYHLWKASSDLSYFSTRHEIEWKDKIFCDVAYSKYDENSYVIKSNCVNNTDVKTNMVMHYFSSMHYPSIYGRFLGQELFPVKIKKPENSLLIDALDFSEFMHEIIRPQDNLVADGFRRGEVRTQNFYNGSAVLLGEKDGDKIHYQIENPNFKNPVIHIRHKNANDVTLKITGDITGKIDIKKSEQISISNLEININQNQNLNFYMSSDSEILLDFYVICEKGESVSASCEFNKAVPTAYENGREDCVDFEKETSLDYKETHQIVSKNENTLILKYENSDKYYGIYWDFDDYDLRYIMGGDLDIYLKTMAHDHVSKVLIHDDKACFSDVFLRPLSIPAHSSFELFSVVCCGDSKEEVDEKLHFFMNNKEVLAQTDEKMEKTACLCEESPYSFSQNIMRATTLTNVTYPIYTKKSYIKHNTPGNWWDSLYTWDSGFCGLGLSVCDSQRAIDCLNAYVTEVGDDECAFIHHGSPVPVQFYLFEEIYNNTQSPEILEYFYPRLKQYYEFMIGNAKSSDMAKFNSGMLSTWSYFYNSAGWDDYPPQRQVYMYGLQETVSCVSNTSQAIRCAKILKLAAKILGLTDDSQKYSDDIQRLSNAIQTHTWDEDAGYFSYLVHDENRNPIGFLKTDDGENFNKGLDGASPFVAGITNESQTQKIVNHLMNKDEILTEIGLSTVDKTAKYFKKDGYWNGSVWMPHQWFYFKALLDYGFGEEAYKVAKIGLDTWKKEVDTSYNCFEHFLIDSGRGAGWHHFSGLSTPVLLWHETYFKKNNVTCGLGAMITEKNISKNNISFKVSYDENVGKTTVIVVGNSNVNYKILVNGIETPYVKRFENAMEFSFIASEKMEIECVEN